MKTIETKNEKLHSYIDGHMSDIERRAFEQQMEQDSDLCNQVIQLVAQNRHLDASVPHPTDGKLQAIKHRADRNVERQKLHFLKAAAIVALVVVSAISGFGVSEYSSRQHIAALKEHVHSSSNSAIAAHTLYSVEVLHPVEVVAEEREHLTRWLSKRLGQPISAPDITSFGFSLVGGRLLPSGNDPAAQFMYENESGERITFFATVSNHKVPMSLRYEQRNNVNAAQWRDGLWDYTVVGEMDRSQMEKIASVLHQQLN